MGKIIVHGTVFIFRKDFESSGSPFKWNHGPVKLLIADANFRANELGSGNVLQVVLAKHLKPDLTLAIREVAYAIINDWWVLLVRVKRDVGSCLGCNGLQVFVPFKINKWPIGLDLFRKLPKLLYVIVEGRKNIDVILGNPAE